MHLLSTKGHSIYDPIGRVHRTFPTNPFRAFVISCPGWDIFLAGRRRRHGHPDRLISGGQEHRPWRRITPLPYHPTSCRNYHSHLLYYRASSSVPTTHPHHQTHAPPL